jgi:hypothetical protein
LRPRQTHAGTVFGTHTKQRLDAFIHFARYQVKEYRRQPAKRKFRAGSVRKEED